MIQFIVISVVETLVTERLVTGLGTKQSMKLIKGCKYTYYQILSILVYY